MRKNSTKIILCVIILLNIIKLSASIKELSFGAKAHLFLMKLMGMYDKVENLKDDSNSKKDKEEEIFKNYDRRFTSSPFQEYKYSGEIAKKSDPIYLHNNVPAELLMRPRKSYSYPLYPTFSNETHVLMDTTIVRAATTTKSSSLEKYPYDIGIEVIKEKYDGTLYTEIEPLDEPLNTILKNLVKSGKVELTKGFGKIYRSQSHFSNHT